ncbi:hypothetical protein [cyanobacterium endosymbiont of Epithemia turgida]|uniref:hypothetical protein n=1 Tax=cyanobacterium endosymbiont of Epithemia turgida TaxID=718217 RepID=UPI001493EEF2|nr:hypothetical protein [cyanobacterium endosymbiont of Epithemia turgida]
MKSTPVEASSVFSVTSGHQFDNDAPNTCYSCVDDYNIPPCAGFSRDYSCLPNLGNTR